MGDGGNILYFISPPLPDFWCLHSTFDLLSWRRLSGSIWASFLFFSRKDFIYFFQIAAKWVWNFKEANPPVLYNFHKNWEKYFLHMSLWRDVPFTLKLEKQIASADITLKKVVKKEIENCNSSMAYDYTGPWYFVSIWKFYFNLMFMIKQIRLNL